MTPFQTTPLHGRFGVELHAARIAEIIRDGRFPMLRDLFEHHSLLLLRNQGLSDEDHMALGRLFGPIEDRKADERKPGEGAEVSVMSNLTADGTVTDEMDLQTLNLKSNMLWHTDSTFMPVPALTNILTSRVTTSTGGATEFTSTRAALHDMPADQRAGLEDALLWHRFSHSRARISRELAALPQFNKWPDQLWPAVWRNPVTGEASLYIASHCYRIDGMDEDASAPIIDAAIAWCTQPHYVYRHEWQVGDVLIWDERAILHRGTPWPYEEPRVLSSICVSMLPEDGLQAARAMAGR